MAAASVLAPVCVFHGRTSGASLFGFPSLRITLPPPPLFIPGDRRIHSLKLPVTAVPVPRFFLKKIHHAGILPQKLLEVSGALALSRRILLCALLPVTFYVRCGISFAAVDDSIRASGFGLKVATALRKTGWLDEAIVFFLATLPVIELRGAIPVGYWMRIDPLKLTIVSVLGNMLPVPFIVLYLKKFASFISMKSASATRFLDILFERAREKAGPVVEFQWLGLMLFVAVPFPGTGAWTGAIVASVLDMSFWPAFSANFLGVLLAGLLVNLLVNLGLKYAVMVGIFLLFISAVMWRFLRSFRSTMASK